MDLIFTKEYIYNLEKELGFSFQQKKILCNIMTHSSFYNDNSKIYKQEGLSSNEIYDFIGDTILNLFVSSFFSIKGIQEPKNLNYFKQKIVSIENVAELIDILKIEEFIKFGNGQKINEKVKASFLKSILGGLFFDSGIQAAWYFFKNKYEKHLEEKFNLLYNKRDFFLKKIPDVNNIDKLFFKQKEEEPNIEQYKKENVVLKTQSPRPISENYNGTCIHNNLYTTKICSVKNKCKIGKCSNNYPCKEKYFISTKCNCKKK